MKIIFCVDKNKISFFSNLLNKKKKDNLQNAKKELVKIENFWCQNRPFIEGFFLKLFKEKVNKEIKVYIFPEDFLIGASQTIDQIILYGQPARTTNFPLAIIVHEIGHIILSQNKSKRPIIIDEIICLMLEDYVYSVLDKKSLSDVWTESELDLFHFNAMKTAIMEISENGVIINRNIDNLINLLSKKLSSDILNIKPPSGLINNLDIK